MVKVKDRNGKTHIFSISIERVPYLSKAQAQFGTFALPDQEDKWIPVESIIWTTAMSEVPVRNIA